MRSKNMRRIMAVFGWILYCLGWVRIFQITPRREPATFALFLTSAAIILVVIVRSWVAHNKRLASRGRRGRLTRYTPPAYSHDHLGRTLIFDANLGSAREVMITVAKDNKMYRAATSTEKPVRPRDNYVEAGVKA
jgi:hypothetical protein